MLRGLGVLMIIGLLVVSTIGMAGEGPLWVRYVGSGTLFILLMLILTQLSNLPNKEEYRRMGGVPPRGEEVYSDPNLNDRGVPHDRDMMGDN